MGKGLLSIRVVKSKMSKKVVSGKKTYRSFKSQYNHDMRFEEMDSNYLKRPNEKNKYVSFIGIDNIINIKNRENNFKNIDKQWEDIKNNHKEFWNKGLHSETKPVLNFLLSFEEDFDLSEEDRLSQIESVRDFIKNKYDYPIYLVQHNDEKSLHYSFSIINYCKKTNRPLAKQIDTSKLQDEIANHLKSDNMDFGHTRGNPKTISLAKHRTIMEGKTLELENNIKSLENDNELLLNKNASLLEDKENLNTEVEQLREDKIEMDSIYSDFEKYQNEVREEVKLIINTFTEAGLNYKGKTQLSLTKLAGRHLNYKDMEKLQKLMGKLIKLTEKEIRNQKK